MKNLASVTLEAIREYETPPVAWLVYLLAFIILVNVEMELFHRWVVVIGCAVTYFSDAMKNLSDIYDKRIRDAQRQDRPE